MYYSVRGNVIHLGQNIAVVECGGVGYKCQTTINTLKNLKLNAEAKLYTYLNVREDAMELFGFYTEEELSAFKTLIGVSGVGPKVGIAILSVLSPQQIALAIASDDLKSITMAPGVGKKLAQRIVLELKDKFKINTNFEGVIKGAKTTAAVGNIPKAIEALSVLGYTAADVSPFISTLDPNLPVEQLIGETLKLMGRN
ncbi:MAG: Holliday junction branch migration protein RuvA [Oscillospiraceae bacterium]|nr:Holliday junction branch migration protein RuvA [Oscillospiraceae bacterium]